ncbi:MAG: glycosyltransferase [Rhodocyclaceae bacterium]|jgi:hypothetical protein|nr:glycosyltransferase [Rhodocyclaceae bacterium]
MTIRIKFLSRLDPREWARYFPDERHQWGDCQFLFEREAREYDWLVVYDDLPPGSGQRRDSACEALACPPRNTMLVTTEPSSIKAYGRAFAAQFGHVLTSQPAWALPHPQRHYQQAANHWFYGSAGERWMSHADMLRGPASDAKTRELSTVYSSKRQWHTLHAQRFAFIAAMQARLPGLALFGRGATPMDDKAEALAPFRYHLAVENHIAPHHITEKLSDAFLGRCLPFYAGAPNADEYFPRGSYIAIDIRDPEGAARIIREAMARDAWAERLPLIEEARRRVLEEHHLFAVIARLIARAEAGTPAAAPSAHRLLSRHAWRKAHPLGALAHMAEKLYVRTRSLRRVHSPADTQAPGT